MDVKMRMNTTIASSLLEVQMDGLTESAIRAAFAKKAVAIHPDTGSETIMAAEFLKQYKKARDVLLEHVQRESQFERCETCKGTGQQSTRSGGLIKCMTCSGAGRYKKKEFRRG